MQWYLHVLKNYAQFNGRARRSEYWYFVLCSLVVTIVLGVFDGMISRMTGSAVGILGCVYGLAVLVPSIAVGVRRLHDTNRSGWWCLLALVPLVGLLLLWFLAQDSDASSNRYGQNPKLVIA